MRPCNFTASLPRYQGDKAQLSRHLTRCEACRTATALLAAVDELPDESTADCPDAALFAAFSEGILPSAYNDRVLRHLQNCGFCLRALRLASSASPVTDESLHAASGELVRADCAIDAYRLAKDLAIWLSTEKFPRERAAVAAFFDSCYDAETADADLHSSDRIPAHALAFAGDKRGTVAIRIALTATLIGRAHLDGACSRVALLEHLPERMANAPIGAPPGLLFADIASWIDRRLQ